MACHANIWRAIQTRRKHDAWLITGLARAYCMLKGRPNRYALPNTIKTQLPGIDGSFSPFFAVDKYS